ncbi:MAG: response regulator transcription factor [Candidatus Dormibacteraeota bacterium]|nr:response regulator transcription factor [Candidatus Dormibacteraeota bacterium]
MGAAGARILVVEDDPDLALLSMGVLQRAGYEVMVAHTGAEGIRISREHLPDLTILDFELPDMDAIEVLDLIRDGADRAPNPVLILTGARHGASDQIRGLEHGATDYLAKGIDRAIFLARVKTALREHRGEEGAIRRGALLIDSRAGTVQLDGRPLHLDRKPMLLLYQLAKQEGAVLTREELLRLVWSSSYEGFERSVDQAVYAARKALGDPHWIQTIAGFGYRFHTLR